MCAMFPVRCDFHKKRLYSIFCSIQERTALDYIHAHHSECPVMFVAASLAAATDNTFMTRSPSPQWPIATEGAASSSTGSSSTSTSLPAREASPLNEVLIKLGFFTGPTSVMSDTDGAGAAATSPGLAPGTDGKMLLFSSVAVWSQFAFYSASSQVRPPVLAGLCAALCTGAGNIPSAAVVHGSAATL